MTVSNDTMNSALGASFNSGEKLLILTLSEHQVQLGTKIHLLLILTCFQLTMMFQVMEECHQGLGFEPELPKPKTVEEINREKAEMLRQLDRLKAKGVRLDKHYTVESDYNEMRDGLERIKDGGQLKVLNSSVRCSLAFITAIEFLNNRFDP